MLNYLTLKISNKEVALNFQIHKAQQVRRVLYAWIAISSPLRLLTGILSAKNNEGPWIDVYVATIFLLFGSTYIVLSYVSKKGVLTHEYFSCVVFSVSIIACSLSNTNTLPYWLIAPDNGFRASFEMTFLILAIFSFLKLERVIFVISPLYLVA